MDFNSRSIRTYEDVLGRAMPEPNTGCWLWDLAETTAGYGKVYNPLRKRAGTAHILAWELLHELIPHDDDPKKQICVLHRCDQPLCVNIDHLFTGTHHDNVRDKESKGRGGQLKGDAHPIHKNPNLCSHGDDHWTRKHPDKVVRGDQHHMRKNPDKFRGDMNPHCKIREADKPIIRARMAAGERQMDLAVEYGVNRNTIAAVCKK